MQNKSEKYSSVYRRCPKVSVAELREAMGGPLNAHRATASLARAAPTGGRCAFFYLGTDTSHTHLTQCPVTASRAADDLARALLGGTLAGCTLHRQSDSDRPETSRQAGEGKRD